MKGRYQVLATRIVVAVSAGIIAVTSVFADTVTLQPTADTGLFQNAPDNNLGTQTFMPVGRTGVGTITRGLVRFDFAGQMPPNAIVNNATLTLTVVFDRGGSPNINAHRMVKSWIEGTQSGGPAGGNIGAPAATGEPSWNRRAHPSTAWGTPGTQAGSDYVTTASASAPLSAGRFALSSAGLIADVQAFVSTPSTNFGWLIKNQNEATSGARRIGSREDSFNSPTLVVNFTVPGTGGAPMEITSSSPLPSGTVGSPYSFTFMVTNGTAPLSWSVMSGTLPGALNISSAGALSGTPTVAGNFNFTVQVADNSGASTNKTFTITINSSPVMIDTVSVLPAGAVAVAYSQTLGASGGQPPFAWSVTSGALPGGLTLSSAGVLSGTPTNSGTFNFTAQVADNAGASTNKAFALTINPPVLAISNPSPLPAGTVNVAYSQTLAASGGTPPYTWLLASGTLPGGLTLSTNGVLSGGPTNSGDFNFTVQVTDGASATANKAFTLAIISPLRIDQVALADNQIRVQFTAQAGQTYAVESNGSLSSTNWQTLTNIAAQANAAVITVMDAISQGERYYRVRTP